MAAGEALMSLRILGLSVFAVVSQFSWASSLSRCPYVSRLQYVLVLADERLSLADVGFCQKTLQIPVQTNPGFWRGVPHIYIYIYIHIYGSRSKGPCKEFSIR